MVLHTFSAEKMVSAEGLGPDGPLIQARDGALFGTTLGGGTSGKGTIFRMTADGTFTTLHSFTGLDGASPFAALVQAADGSFYGTTARTVFRMTSDGTVKTLHAFLGGPDGLPTGIIQASDGNLYATTAEGGAARGGTILRITPEGIVTVLYEFTGGPNGTHPDAPLMQASNGHFYGTTGGGPTMAQALGGGGALSTATVFRMTVDGTIRTLHTFAWSDNVSGLIQAPDGSLFGTTSSGGSSNSGTVFKVTLDGSMTTVYSFAVQPDDAAPFAGVTRARDGSFYGVTTGRSGGGVIFRITP